MLVLKSKKDKLEKTLLSRMLIDSDKVNLEEFKNRISTIKFIGKNEDIKKSMLECWDRHKTLDPTLLTVDLNSVDYKEFNDFMATGSIFGSDFKTYLSELEDVDRKLRIKTMLDNVDDNKTYIDVIKDIEENLDIIKNEEIKTDNTVTTGISLMLDFLEDLDKKPDPNKIFKSGLKVYDEIVTMSRQDLVIIGARPSMGKTATMLTLAKNMAKQGKKVGIFSLEMTNGKLFNRLMSSMSGVPLNKIKNKFLNEEDKDRIARTVNLAEDIFKNLFFFEGVGTNIDEIELYVKKMVMDNDLDVVMIDYLQFITHTKQFQRDDLKIADITKRLKVLFKKEDILGIVLAQLNRGVEGRADKRPIMSDLDGSSEIEKTADIITFLYRDEYYNFDSEQKGILELITAKQRDGEVGAVHVRFMGEYQRITDYTTKVE